MIVQAGKDLIAVRHPDWSSRKQSWEKWRSVYRGGDEFNEAYIKKFSNLEDATDFKSRKEISPTPSFAKTVINEIKNSIFQRMAEISRSGGPKSYQTAVSGQDFGVDLHGTSMTTFLGREVLPELLTMAKVGVYVDMPSVEGRTLADKQGKVPYLYVYKAEEIFSWAYRKDQIEEFQAVLLVDFVDDLHEGTGLPKAQWKRHRLCWLDKETKVAWCRLYDDEGTQIDMEGNETNLDFKIGLPYIPFITGELSDSLLADVANHQISLVNAESADMAYILKSNFPIFTEQTDDRDYTQYGKGPDGAGGDGTAGNAALAGERNIRVGNSVGRRYRKGLNKPEFINPSPEPVQVSMEKQAQLKDDIRTLVNLSLSSIKPKMASAESKALDMQGLESGLSYIGLELERIERRIARIWSDYEGGNAPAKVTYPTKWSLESEEDKRKDAEQLEKLRDTVPSPTFQKLISEKIVGKLVGDEITTETREKIASEIKNAKTITADPDVIFQSIEAGVLDLELAAEILGFPKETVKKAAKDHADRLARISESQSEGPGAEGGGARGVGDLSGSPGKDGAAEKKQSRDNTKEGNGATTKVRGEGQ